VISQTPARPSPVTGCHHQASRCFPSGSAPTWPTEVERVEAGQDSSEKSTRFRAELRDFLAHVRPDLRIEQDASALSQSGSNSVLTIGVLVSDKQNHYGVLVAIFTDPPITRSDGKCLPALHDRCSIHGLHSGKAMMVDNSSMNQGQRLVTAELIRADGFIPVTVRSMTGHIDRLLSSGTVGTRCQQYHSLSKKQSNCLTCSRQPNDSKPLGRPSTSPPATAGTYRSGDGYALNRRRGTFDMRTARSAILVP
jgi:hypothetical protein